MAETTDQVNVLRVTFILMAEDMERATTFYRDVMGLKIDFESPNWTELIHGDAIVALHGGGSGEHTKTGLSFHVPDLPLACRLVAGGGGTVVEEPHARPGEPIMLAQVRDTEGNEFGISQHI